MNTPVITWRSWKLKAEHLERENARLRARTEDVEKLLIAEVNAHEKTKSQLEGALKVIEAYYVRSTG